MSFNETFSLMFYLLPAVSGLNNQPWSEIEFRLWAVNGGLDHSRLNKPTLCFDVVWLPLDVKADFFFNIAVAARDWSMSKLEREK